LTSLLRCLCAARQKRLILFAATSANPALCKKSPGSAVIQPIAARKIVYAEEGMPALSRRSIGTNALLAAAGWMTLAVPYSLGQTGTAIPPASSAPANAPYVATMTYDVASVRENKNADPNVGITMSGQFVPHTTMFRAINWSIENLVGVAYGVNRFQIVGVPKWQWPTVFVIEAKGDSEADAKIAALTPEQQLAEQRHMLQALMEERFKLKTHWETKEGDVYNLVVAKGGPKLRAEGFMPLSADELKGFGDRPVPALYQKNDGQGFDFIAHGCSMGQLVEMLTAQFGRPVTDKTGLTGNYDFVLKYKARWDRDRQPDDLDPTPPMDQALQQELGLKVDTARGPVRMLVIDHIEKPSEN
jgi:uncharacterized protein (TIGR03435 family)